jgi:integrase
MRIPGLGGRPKKASTIVTDTGRIERHIVPLIGTRRVKDLTKADINKVLKDIMAGKTRVSVKTKKLRGKAIVRGGAGTATRTVGLIESNPAHGVRKPKDNLRKRRLSEAEYRILGRMLRDAAKQEKYITIVDIIRQIALTGCRRSEMIGLKWTEADTDASCLRLEDSKEGESVRPTGLPVVEYLERTRTDDVSTYVFPGQGRDNVFGSFPNHWKHIFEDSPLSDVTPHVLRHSFASIANDLGFTEVTFAALVGHATGSVTSKYIHTLDTALIMAADTIAGYVQGLLDGIEFKQTAYALDRNSRKVALARFLKRASVGDLDEPEQEGPIGRVGTMPTHRSTSAAPKRELWKSHSGIFAETLQYERSSPRGASGSSRRSSLPCRPGFVPRGCADSAQCASWCKTAS